MLVFLQTDLFNGSFEPALVLWLCSICCIADPYVARKLVTKLKRFLFLQVEIHVKERSLLRRAHGEVMMELNGEDFSTLKLGPSCSLFFLLLIWADRTFLLKLELVKVNPVSETSFSMKNFLRWMVRRKLIL